jgi:hypothetical protein
VAERIGPGVALAAAIACACAASGAALAADRDREILEAASQRWRGSVCRLRVALEITNERAGGDSSASRWYMFHPEGDKGLHYRLRFTPRDVVRPLLVKRYLMPGTELVLGDWTTDRAGPGTAVAVRSRFAQVAADAQFDFLPSAGFSLDVKRVPDVERFLRVELCEVSRPAEGAPPVPAHLRAGAPATGTTATGAAPAAATTADARASSAATGAPAAAGTTGFRPAVSIVATSVSPARVLRGDELELVISYRIEGLPPGAAFETHERRTILAGERVLATFDDRFDRVNDTYVSTRRIRTPADLAPGMLTFRSSVRLAGLEATGEALFELR